MEIREKLNQAMHMGRRIDALLERQRHYRELSRALRDGSPELEALEREVGERIEAYAALVREVDRRIEALEDQSQREVMQYRYLNGWSWKIIAMKMGFSREWVWRLHARALARLDEQDGSDVKCRLKMKGVQ